MDVVDCSNTGSGLLLTKPLLLKTVNAEQILTAKFNIPVRCIICSVFNLLIYYQYIIIRDARYWIFADIPIFFNSFLPISDIPIFFNSFLPISDIPIFFNSFLPISDIPIFFNSFLPIYRYFSTHFCPYPIYRYFSTHFCPYPIYRYF